MKIIDKLTSEMGGSVRDKGIRGPFFSFEFFPPKTEAGTENLYLRMERMTALQPLFVDVTWGAGGSTKDLTMAISQYSQTYFGVEVLMHLTCTNLTEEELKRILNAARAAGIQNILALRGDPPKGAIKWKKVAGGLERAIDLVRLIRREHGDYFCIAVAGFPEGHPINAAPLRISPQKGARPAMSGVDGVGGGDGEGDDYGSSGGSGSEGTRNRRNRVVEAGSCTQDDIVHLREKIEAGADFVLTQFFYDSQVFLRYLDQCRTNGIICPIIPGIMPIQGFNSFEKMTTFCRTSVPEKVWRDMQHFQDNDEEVKNYGVQLCVKICKDLYDAGVPGFHFYTLNLEKSVLQILEGMHVKESAAVRRALPWRGSRTVCKNSNSNLNAMIAKDGTAAGSGHGSLTNMPTAGSAGNSSTASAESKLWHIAGEHFPSNSQLQLSQNTSLQSLTSKDSDKPRMEDVRPINWANRTKSYIKRTVTWDEFPNGRWGDNRSPAFGELSDSHFFRPSEGSKEDRLAMWGDAPTDPPDVYEVFALYVEGKIPILPWCETPTQDETHVISTALASFNRAGFLTINSQPVVNGEKSDHPVFGWGGTGGRVYQKGYIEFFTSPENLNLIMDIAKDRPSLNVYAVDCHGNPIFTGMKGVTALTWGVFPNKEILQPTVFDPDTFVVWSEEAFQLWTSAWAELYDDESESSALLYDIHDTYYLVAIIDHEYIDSDLYSVFTDAIIERRSRTQKKEDGMCSSEESAVDIDS